MFLVFSHHVFFSAHTKPLWPNLVLPASYPVHQQPASTKVWVLHGTVSSTYVLRTTRPGAPYKSRGQAPCDLPSIAGPRTPRDDPPFPLLHHASSSSRSTARRRILSAARASRRVMPCVPLALRLLLRLLALQPCPACPGACAIAQGCAKPCTCHRHQVSSPNRAAAAPSGFESGCRGESPSWVSHQTEPPSSPLWFPPLPALSHALERWELVLQYPAPSMGAVLSFLQIAPEKHCNFAVLSCVLPNLHKTPRSISSFQPSPIYDLL